MFPDKPFKKGSRCFGILFIFGIFIAVFKLYMIKRVWLLCVVSISLLLVSFKTTDEWLIITSTMGHYAISFPGYPTEKTRGNNDVHILSYSPTDSEVLILAWTDMHKYYPANKKISELLEDAMDGAITSMDATDVKTTNLVLNANPYIEFTFNTPHITGKERIYIINKFQYSVMALGAPASGITQGMEHFLTTFIYLP